MPELPEVETVRRSLQEQILGRKILKVKVNRPKTLEGSTPSEFEKALTGKVFKSVQRKAKYLFLELESGEVISVHLKMSGAFLLHSPDQEIPKHTHVIFDLGQNLIRPSGTFPLSREGKSSSEAQLELRFKDLRAFGRMSLYPSLHEAQQVGSIPNLAPEPIEDTFTLSYFKKQLQKFSAPIKALLLEQTKLVSGVGNIYADESLFLSGIQPGRASNSLTASEADKLHKAIIKVIGESIKVGGTTIRDYVNAQGNIGEYALQLFVYGRKKQNCKVCDTPIEYIRLAQRGTHYCPNCQK